MINETALAMYRHLISHPQEDGDAIAFDLGLTSEQLNQAAQDLLDARLVHALPTSDRRLVALPPEVALGCTVYEEERIVRQLQAQINSRRVDYLALVPHYTEARAKAIRSPDIYIIEDLTAIRDFLADACRDTRDELLIAHPTRHLSASSLNVGLPQDLEMLSRGVVRRSLYLSSNRDSVAVQRAVARATLAGAEVRVLATIPVRVMCFDAKMAMLSRSLAPDDKAAIVVRDANVAHIIRQVFMAAWGSAEPFAVDDVEGTAPGQLSVAILAGLAAGQSDEQIARNQHISVRTCRRHIHHLMEELSAQSRFRLGMLAAKRGWI